MERALLRQLVHKRDDTARSLFALSPPFLTSSSSFTLCQARAASRPESSKQRATRVSFAGAAHRAWGLNLQRLNDDLGTSL